MQFAFAGIASLVMLSCTEPALAQYWSRTWMDAPLLRLPVHQDRPALENATIRQVVRISSGGKAIRLLLSNELSDVPLLLGEVHVGLSAEDGAIVAGTDRFVKFAGKQGASVPGRAPLLSDPVDLAVKPLTRLAITIHLPVGARQPTEHVYSAATAWVAPGNQVAAPRLLGAATMKPRLIIAAVEVETFRPTRTVVAFGDSITDGAHSTIDTDRRWPDHLAERLHAAGQTDVAVANAGIGANRLLSEGEGQNALARFDRDVLSVPGVSHVIILEGINDIGNAARSGQTLEPQDIIAAYRQLVTRAHGRSVKVILSTILPYKGAKYWSADVKKLAKQ